MPVNSFSPNPFGLYNVHGNVWEWVEDCWSGNYTGSPTEGSAWRAGCSSNYRELRGGSWAGYSAFLRSAVSRSGTTVSRNYSYGFRLARTLFTP